MAPKYFIAVALGLTLVSPARSADLKKYLPEDTTAYIHINIKQFMTAPVVRKAIPMAFEKYGDQILPLVQMAKALNPATPDIPEDQVKKGIEELKKEETIAKGLDAAKDVVTDIVIAGDANDDSGKSFVFAIKVPQEVTAEAVEAIVKFIPKEQVKSKTHKKDKTNIYELEPQQSPIPISLFLLVPEPGVICLTLAKESAEATVDRASGNGKSGAKEELAKLMAERKTSDFVFFASVKGEGDDKEVTVGKVTLDKDIGAAMRVTYASAEKAKKNGEELKSNLNEALDKVKEFLGDKKDAAKAITDRAKTKVDGKTVSAEVGIPGSVIEKLLAKDS
jgi:hypothetical protein